MILQNCRPLQCGNHFGGFWVSLPIHLGLRGNWFWRHSVIFHRSKWKQAEQQKLSLLGVPRWLQPGSTHPCVCSCIAPCVCTCRVSVYTQCAQMCMSVGACVPTTCACVLVCVCHVCAHACVQVCLPGLHRNVWVCYSYASVWVPVCTHPCEWVHVCTFMWMCVFSHVNALPPPWLLEHNNKISIEMSLKRQPRVAKALNSELENPTGAYFE